MSGPYLTMDLDKIEHNSRSIVELCGDHGIAVTGVTKLACGHPEVAKAMLRGGVSAIADSRLENIRRLRRAGISSPLMLLRLPPLSGVREVVDSVEVSLNTELAVLEGLSAAAVGRGTTHEVILMVDLGDLREGVRPDELVPLAKQAVGLPGISLAGVGANLACLSGVVPTTAAMERLVNLADDIEKACGIGLKWISGINSSGLALVAAGRMPRRVNHARIGEAILLGRETVHRSPWPGTCQDAFVLHAEVLELKVKPSVPVGERSEDAFGHRPVFDERGDIRRALVNVGREDVEPEGVRPVDPALRVLGASSGYLVVDTTAAGERIGVGDELVFSLGYGALLRAMTSEYVKKRPRGGAPEGAE